MYNPKSNAHITRDSCSWCGGDVAEPAPEYEALCSDACRKAYKRFAA